MTGVLELLILCAVCMSVCLASDNNKPYLIFPTHRGISRVDVGGGSSHQTLVNVSQEIHTVDFHWRMGLLFWTDYAGHAVHQALLNGSSQTTVATEIPRPAGLAVDWINDKLYFSFENASTNHIIAVYDIREGGGWEALLASANRVWDIACDPHTQEIYWMTSNSIERSSLDGSGVETLQSFGPLSHVFSFALDTTNRQLFWIDRCNSDHIHVLNLTSLVLGAVPSDTVTEPLHGLTVYGDALYWTSAATHSIMSTSVEGGDKQEVFHDSDSAHWRGVRAVHPHLQPRAAPESANSTLNSSTPLPQPTPEPSRSSVVSVMAQSEVSSFPELLMPVSSFIATTTQSDVSVVTRLPITPSSLPPSSSVIPAPSSDVEDSEANTPIEFLKQNPIAVGMVAGSILFVGSTVFCLCVVVIYKRRSRRKYKRRKSTIEETQDLWMVNRHAERGPQGHINPMFSPSTANRVSTTQATIIQNPHLTTPPQPSAPPIQLHPIPHSPPHLPPPQPPPQTFRQPQPPPQGHHMGGHPSQQLHMPSHHGRTFTQPGQY